MLVFILIATTMQLVLGQGDHRRRPSERDEDDATFAKVRVNITHTLNFTFSEVRRYSQYNQVRKNTVLDGLNVSAPIAENVKNPLFLQPEETERISATSDAAAAELRRRPMSVRRRSLTIFLPGSAPSHWSVRI